MMYVTAEILSSKRPSPKENPSHSYNTTTSPYSPGFPACL